MVTTTKYHTETHFQIWELVQKIEKVRVAELKEIQKDVTLAGLLSTEYDRFENSWTATAVEGGIWIVLLLSIYMSLNDWFTRPQLPSERGEKYGFED